MSGFLSPKFLKYRGATAPTTITSKRGEDVLLATDDAQRRRWRLGLLFATWCVAAALVARLAFFVASLGGAGATTYVIFGAVNSVVWVVAVFMITPRTLAAHWPWMRGLRLAARGLSLGWLVGYACLIIRHSTSVTPGQWVDAGVVLGRLAGSLGVMIVAFMMSHVAEHIELDAAGRRFNAAVWLLWVPTALAQVLSGPLPWIAMILLGMVLFFWGWIMLGMALGFMAMYRHAAWGRRHVMESLGRDERIAAKRRAMDSAVASTVRQTPRTSDAEISPNGDE